MKQILYDRDQSKLIERVCEMRKTNPDIKIGKIQTPYTQDEVYSIEVQS